MNEAQILFQALNSMSPDQYMLTIKSSIEEMQSDVDTVAQKSKLFLAALSYGAYHHLSDDQWSKVLKEQPYRGKTFLFALIDMIKNAPLSFKVDSGYPDLLMMLVNKAPTDHWEKTEFQDTFSNRYVFLNQCILKGNIELCLPVYAELLKRIPADRWKDDIQGLCEFSMKHFWSTRQPITIPWATFFAVLASNTQCSSQFWFEPYFTPDKVVFKEGVSAKDFSGCCQSSC